MILGDDDEFRTKWSRGTLRVQPSNVIAELKDATSRLDEALRSGAITEDCAGRFERSTRGLALLIRAWCDEHTDMPKDTPTDGQ